MATGSPLDDALRLTRPGDTVVSVTDILKRLDGTLSRAEQERLLRSLLANGVPLLQPGDLLQASYFNALTLAVRDIQQELANLKSGPAQGGALAIVSVEPRQQEMGGVIAIRGRNLAPSDKQVVTVGGAIVTEIFHQQSTSEMLVVRVPDVVQGVAPGRTGTPVSVVVSGVNGSDKGTVWIVARTQGLVTGSISVMVAKGPDPTNKVKAGETVSYEFQVNVVTTADETFSVRYELVPALPGWTVDGDREFDCKANQTRTGLANNVRATVSIPAGAAANDAVLVVLHVAAQSNPNGFSKDSPDAPPFRLVVDQKPKPPQTEISFELKDYGDGMTVVDREVKMPADGTDRYLQFDVTFKSAGTYNVLQPKASGASSAMWTIKRSLESVKVDTAGSRMQLTYDVSAAAGAGAVDVTFGIRSLADAALEADFVYRLGAA